ncbi:MAG: NAD(P)-dependent oxidoreductase [Myxococcaceae bacterium]
MKILVIGATGKAGLGFIQQALKAGHEVTAFVRDPSKLSLEHEKLRAQQGDVSNKDSLLAAASGQDVIVCAVGPRDEKNPGTLISDAARACVEAQKNLGVKRTVFVSGLMVGELEGAGFFPRTLVKFFRNLRRALYQDKVLAESLLKSSGQEFVIVRPPVFDTRPAKNTFRASENLDISLATMSADDVGAAILRAVTDAGWAGKAVEVSY